MLACTQIGDGARDVLLLHGFLGAGRNLGAIARRWVDQDPRLRLLLADLLGHGSSPPLYPGADLLAQAEAVRSLIAAIARSPIAVVGHSLGGRVALELAAHHPELLTQVVLLDVSPGRLQDRAGEVDSVLAALLAVPERAPTREDMRRALRAQGLGGTMSEWLLTNLVPDAAAYRWRIDRRALADFHRLGLERDLWPVVERGAPPVHLVYGEASSFVEPEEAVRVAQAGGEVRSVPFAGHFLHADQPVETLAAIRAVLGER